MAKLESEPGYTLISRLTGQVPWPWLSWDFNLQRRSVNRALVRRKNLFFGRLLWEIRIREETLSRPETKHFIAKPKTLLVK